MFFLDCSLKNRLIYLADSSALTSRPLGRELPALLLFSVVPPSRAAAPLQKLVHGAVVFSLGCPGTCRFTDPCGLWCLLLSFGTFPLKCNVYRKAPSCLHNPVRDHKWNTPGGEAEQWQHPVSPPCTPVRSLPSAPPTREPPSGLLTS